MLTPYGLRDGRLTCLAPLAPSTDNVVRIELHDPTHEEEKAVETLLGLQLPTRQEMAEIEESARLYEEHGVLVMTGRSSTALPRADLTAPRSPSC